MSHSEKVEQRSAQWYEARKGLVTASNVGAILGVDPYRDEDDVIRAMVRDYHGAEREFTGNVATEYGTFHEAGALIEYQMETGRKVQKCGFFKADVFGASPDGLVGEDGLLEIKCPYRLRKDGDENSHRSINVQPHYYAQMQLQMAVTGRNWCDFYQWSPSKGTMLERVFKSEEWADKNMPILAKFHQRYISELVNPDHLKPLRKIIENEAAAKLLAEYNEVCDQLDFATTRKKEIIEELAKLSKDRDAIICGRNFTKVERAGSVSYAKVVKDHLPGIDLSPYTGSPTSYWKLS